MLAVGYVEVRSRICAPGNSWLPQRPRLTEYLPLLTGRSKFTSDYRARQNRSGARLSVPQ